MKTSFDAVAWVHEGRARIDEEDRGFSRAEKREKTRNLLETDPLWLQKYFFAILVAALFSPNAAPH